MSSEHERANAALATSIDAVELRRAIEHCRRMNIDCASCHSVCDAAEAHLRAPKGDDEEAPYVCPGCHAVAPERCLPGCIDDEIERDRQDALMRGDYDDRDEDGGADNG